MKTLRSITYLSLRDKVRNKTIRESTEELARFNNEETTRKIIEEMVQLLDECIPMHSTLS